MCYYSEYTLEISTETAPVARKEHRCSECHKRIYPGQQYNRVEGLGDGYWHTIKTCARCQGLREAISRIEVKRGCAHHESQPCYGELWEAIHDMDHLQKREVGLEFARLLKPAMLLFCLLLSGCAADTYRLTEITRGNGEKVTESRGSLLPKPKALRECEDCDGAPVSERRVAPEQGAQAGDSAGQVREQLRPKDADYWTTQH